MRQSRKLDHINYAIQLSDGPKEAGFADFTLLHNCLPEISWEEIDISSQIAGLDIMQPIIINAITGGTKDVLDINARLAEMAAAANLAMAVGSQYAAIEDKDNALSYQIVRKKNPKGIIFSNLGAYVTPDEALQAIDMLEAEALQLHLNPAQEIIMAEGDRNFTGYLKNIEKIVKKSPVPVIVKEVGCGIAREQAKALIEAGVQAIDVGGLGGTNFMAIEAARRNVALPLETLCWGIPTALSALETASILSKDGTLIVSGGIRTPLDTIKALAIGGSAVGIAAPFLRLINQPPDAFISWFNDFIQNIKQFMLLTGAKNIKELRETPLVITGYSREWLLARGIDISHYAMRKKHGC
ncbi:MAG: type 2 isopentenyl-diphosphate Delta-isomerase [Pelosinus sp.]|nr:type 2 isopentenyl-diphosphate Delta-isomerase [Pelosinus sp.]